MSKHRLRPFFINHETYEDENQPFLEWDILLSVRSKKKGGHPYALLKTKICNDANI